MKPFLFLLILLFLQAKLFAQDTIVFSQENSVLFSNKYILYPKSNKFEHKFKTDDGQLWYGQGIYNVEGNKISFHFKNSNKCNLLKVNSIYNFEEKRETIKIKFLDEDNKTISPSYIKINDIVFNSDFDGLISIDKSKISSNIKSIKFFHNGEGQKIKLENIQNINAIEIIGCDFNNSVHYESNFTRTLKYNKKKIISDDFYNTTNKRKVCFKIE